MARDLFAKCAPPQAYSVLQEAGLYPYFVPIEASFGTEVQIGGRRVLMAGSNNYLGLTHDPRVIEAACDAARKFGTGCTGSRFLNGTLQLHVELEERLADLTQKEACQVFSTGYQTSIGVLQAIGDRKDLILCDRENHASILDGARLSYAEVRKYQHADMDSLEDHLSAAGDRGTLLVTDGLFSMTGEIARLPEIVKSAHRFGARVLIDDAHAFGVLGERGAGTADHFGLDKEVDLIMATFSKSLAGIGGFCSGPRAVIDYIRHKARSLIFSASVPPSVCAASLRCLDLIEEEPERRMTVLGLAARARSGLESMGFNTGPSETPIVPVILGDWEKVFRFWRILLQEGVFVNPVTSPGVPPGMDLLRCSFMATHSEEQIDRFLEAFDRARGRLELEMELVAAPSAAS